MSLFLGTGLDELFWSYEKKEMPELSELAKVKSFICKSNDWLIIPDLDDLNNLEMLDCSGNQLIILPNLPTSLKRLDCGYNELTEIPNLPSLEILTTAYNKITSINALNLKTMVVSYSNLFKIPILPYIQELTIKDNVGLTCVTNLIFATNLNLLNLQNNNRMDVKLEFLSSLTKLVSINISYNAISLIPAVPTSIIKLVMGDNSLEHLPELSNCTRLEELDVGSNYLKSLPNIVNLPLKYLYLNENKLTELPELPETIENLFITNNFISFIKKLPKKLRVLSCENNKLTELPELPSGIITVCCGINNITTLPKIPETLEELDCIDTKISNLPFLPNSLYCLDIRNTNIDFSGIYNIPEKLCNFYYTNLPKFTSKEWRKIYKFKQLYYKLKFGKKLERYYIRVRNKKINLELLYSPNVGHYKQLVDPITLQYMQK